MQEREPGLLDQRQGVFEHRLGLGRKAGDQVGAEGGVGAHGADLAHQLQGVGAAVAALHPLQDHVVAGLQRQVQVGHQPRLDSQAAHQVGVDLGRVDGRQPQARQLGDQLQDPRDELAERRLAGQVRPPARHVHAGQHHLPVALGGEPPHLVHDLARRGRARVAAAVGDDAEGAAVVAAVLHLDVGARAVLQAVDQVAGGFPHAHDVVDPHAHRLGLRCVGPGLALFRIAQHEVDLGHAGEGGGGRSGRRSR